MENQKQERQGPSPYPSISNQSSEILAAHDNRLLRHISDTSGTAAACHNWAIKMGMHRQLEEEEIKSLVKFLHSQFFDLSLPDIDLAFDMAAAGKIQVKDIDTYENFSLPYVGKILGPYKELLRQARLEKHKVDESNVPPERQLKDAEGDEHYYLTLLEFIEREKKMPMTWNWDAVYFHMEDSGIMDETKEVLKELIKEARESYVAAVRHDGGGLKIIHERMSDARQLSAYKRKWYVHYKLKQLGKI